MNMTDIDKVKLVIWDLDDTFWQGTLSEGPVELIGRNVETLKYLVDHGVMNSIVSKNNFDDARQELEKHGLWEYFVFPSIDWTPKGARIKSVIENMALRPANVLFIDDNSMNLREASFVLPQLMVLDAAELPVFWDSLGAITKTDPEHKRLKQYRILQTKCEAKNHAVSIDDFLLQSNIRVTIRTPEDSDLDRIHEMIMRTNQLNYTKDRCPIDALQALFHSDGHRFGIVDVADNYGDYGTVGFFALDTATRTLRHFLFSCRTLGMGIEQYVYQQLGFPSLNVVGDVANNVVPENIVTWINTGQAGPVKVENTSSRNGRRIKVLVKGPCDMKGTIDFINAGGADITEEFNCVNDRGVSITGFNHTSNMLQGLSAPTSALDSLVSQVPMIDASLFRTRLFDGDWDVVFLSLLPDCHEGVYERKSDGLRFTFSSFNFDFTNPDNFNAILEGDFNCHNYKFSREELESLHRDFTFLGHLPAEEIAANIDTLIGKLPGSTTAVLLLGNTKGNPDDAQPEFKGQVTVNREVNDVIKRRFADRSNVRIIDYTDLIETADDVRDANHLSRRARYRLSQLMEAEIHTAMGRPGSAPGRMPYALVMVRRTFKRLGRVIGNGIRRSVRRFARKTNNA